jgi:hypothetical protein
VGRRERITIPVDLSQAARNSARDLAVAVTLTDPRERPGAVPWLVVTYDQLQRMPLDPRAAFIVSLIDGRCTVEMLLDISGMSENETLGILSDLVRLKAVELRAPE